MNKKEFFEQIDRRDGEAQDADNRALFAILDELSSENQDPGTAYWNLFNHRLQQRLERSQSRWSWLRWPALAFALTAMLLFVFIPRDVNTEHVGLDHLSTESLALIGDFYEFDADTESSDLGFELEDDSWDLLIQTYGQASGHEELILDGMMEEDLQYLKESWNMEG